jgi:hypothetical protein
MGRKAARKRKSGGKTNAQRRQQRPKQDGVAHSARSGCTRGSLASTKGSSVSMREKSASKTETSACRHNTSTTKRDE